MEGNAIRLHFEGEGHSVDANTLASTLIAYSDILQIINSDYGAGEKTISIKVNSVDQGSFLIDLSIVERALRSLFSKEFINYSAAISTIFSAVLLLYKELKGRQAKNEEVKTITNITNINILQVILNVYNKKETRERASQSFRRLSDDAAVDGLEVITKDRTCGFKKDDFKDLVYCDFASEEPEEDERYKDIDEATLVIVSMSFEKGNNWKFIYSGIPIGFQVKDDALMERIDSGERFGKGDAIKVKLRILQRYDKTLRTFVNKSYKILEFHEHIVNDIRSDSLL